MPIGLVTALILASVVGFGPGGDDGDAKGPEKAKSKAKPGKLNKSKILDETKLLRREMAALGATLRKQLICPRCMGKGRRFKKTRADREGDFFNLVPIPCPQCQGLSITPDGYFHNSLATYYRLLTTVPMEMRRVIEPIPRRGLEILNSVKNDKQAAALTDYWYSHGNGRTGAFVLAVEGQIIFEHKDPTWAVMLAGPINHGGYDNPSMVLVFHDYIPHAARARGKGIFPERFNVVAYSEPHGFYSKWVKTWKDKMEEIAKEDEEKRRSAKRVLRDAKSVEKLFKLLNGTDRLLTVADIKQIRSEWFGEFPHWRPEHLRTRKSHGKGG